MFEVRDLEACFRKNGQDYPAVTGLSYKIEHGEILGIVGESGCGKSISSLALLGLLPKNCRVTNGIMRINGEKYGDFSPENLEDLRGDDIAMIFQEPMTALNPLFTVGWQIGEAYEIHHPKATKEEVRTMTFEIMRKVGLPRVEEVFFNYPHQLSGGMRQRVVIAMALINRPEVIIADEPTTALDVTIQAQILQLLQKLNQEEGTSVILISHDLGIIREICDNVIVMYAGHVVESGNVDTIFANPQHPYTKGLIASIPSMAKKGEKLHTIRGTVPDLYLRNNGQCPFADRCDFATDCCRNSVPDMTDIGTHHVRCFLAKAASQDAVTEAAGVLPQGTEADHA